MFNTSISFNVTLTSHCLCITATFFDALSIAARKKIGVFQGNAL